MKGRSRRQVTVKLINQNMVIVAGNIGQTIKARATKGVGTKFTKLSLATSRARLSEGRKAQYEIFGFQLLASNPLRMLLPVSAVRKLIAGRRNVGAKEGKGPDSQPTGYE